MIIPHEKIQEAKEKLGDKNADLMQDLLKMDKYSEQRKVGCCPNPEHEDHTPSCSYNPKTYTFHCFSCGFSIDLIGAHMMVCGSTFLQACQYLFEQADIPFDFDSVAVCQRKRDYRYPKPEYGENKEKVYEYWGSRGISPQTIDYLNIQQDKFGNTLFQYFDLNEKLVTVKVRKSQDVPHGETKIWHLANADHEDILYNLQQINPEEPLIITCGEGDAATAVECGFKNTVSINGGDGNTRWISECWDWLQQFSEIILVPDNDESGKKFTKEVSNRLGEYRIKIADVSIVISPLGEDPREANDLNELLIYGGPEIVREVIRDAKETEIPAIIDYTDVKRFDMSEVPGFMTGIHDLDDALDKIYVGSVTVLTGIAGSGKTSLLSTLICQAVDQGYPAFVYSGELSNPSLKSWLDFVHAGRRGLNEYRSRTGTPFYKVNVDAYRRINAYYRGQIFFYKDTFDQKVSMIFQTAEMVVRRYGVKLLVFDNLTSMDLENDDNNKYQKQEDFIRNIVSFATKWNVACIVVLHPKKMDIYRKMSIFDLQGVSAAINLTHRILALYRVSPKEKEGKVGKSGIVIEKPVPYDVTIEVLKDRFGSGGNKEVGIFYDVPSKRFYDSPESLDHKYNWDEESDYSGIPIPFGEVKTITPVDPFM